MPKVDLDTLAEEDLDALHEAAQGALSVFLDSKGRFKQGITAPEERGAKAVVQLTEILLSIKQAKERRQAVEVEAENYQRRIAELERDNAALRRRVEALEEDKRFLVLALAPALPSPESFDG